MAKPKEKWCVIYENDTGLNDDYFDEWWDVKNNTDGKNFKCYDEDDANALCNLLNERGLYG